MTRIPEMFSCKAPLTTAMAFLTLMKFWRAFLCQKMRKIKSTGITDNVSNANPKSNANKVNTIVVKLTTSPATQKAPESRKSPFLSHLART
jgi:hypothetical protein